MDAGVAVIAFLVTAAVIIFGLVLVVATRYRRCPSDRVLVKYGWLGKNKGRSSECIHGGATFVFPVLQGYGWLDLTPVTIEIDLVDALSQENIRVNTPSTFTVGISTEPGVMENAAERLLGLPMREIQELARDMIFGQMRVVIATMPIIQINTDRDQFILNITQHVDPELRKIGLRLINVNIRDVHDNSGYIEALGREAAAQAINDAKRKVAEQERDGEIGKANAERAQRIEVAQANAQAVEGENLSKVKVAESDASRREAEAEAERRATAAEKVRKAQALQEAYQAEGEAERKRGEREQATRYADEVVPAIVQKQKIETLAEAEAERTRRVKQGEADGIQSIMEAEATGTQAKLQKQASGFQDIVKAAGGSSQLGALLMITDKLPELIETQVKAISNLKIDSITVWDSGKGADGNNSTANFLSGLINSLPPLHEITKNVGLDLPDYLGSLQGDKVKDGPVAQSSQRHDFPLGRNDESRDGAPTKQRESEPVS